MTTAKNLWHTYGSPYSKPVFEYPRKAIYERRGVQVFANPSGSFDYVAGGAAICQRAGFNQETAALVIDGILDGKDTGHHHWVSDTVAAHLRGLGFTPCGYSDAKEGAA
jgi:hypothetical protein